MNIREPEQERGRGVPARARAGRRLLDPRRRLVVVRAGRRDERLPDSKEPDGTVPRAHISHHLLLPRASVLLRPTARLNGAGTVGAHVAHSKGHRLLAQDAQ